MNDFNTEVINDACIVTVNLTRAIFNEVKELQKLISNVLAN